MINSYGDLAYIDLADAGKGKHAVVLPLTFMSWRLLLSVYLIFFTQNYELEVAVSVLNCFSIINFHIKM